MALSESSRIQCQLLEAGENKDFILHNTSPRRRAGTAGMAIAVSSHHHYNNRRHCNDDEKITIKSHLVLHNKSLRRRAVPERLVRPSLYRHIITIIIGGVVMMRRCNQVSSEYTVSSLPDESRLYLLSPHHNYEATARRPYPPSL